MSGKTTATEPSAHATVTGAEASILARMARSRWFALGAMLALITLTAITYANADHEEFFFDSSHGEIERKDPQAALSRYLTNVVTSPRPNAALTHATFMLNAVANEVLGTALYDVTGFLIGNVLLHALNACLLFLFLRQLLVYLQTPHARASWIALGLAALFTVHPLHATSVVYIIQRRGQLVLTFYLLAMLSLLRLHATNAAVRHCPDEAPSLYIRLVLVFSILLCCFLALKSKTLGVTLPLALLMLEFCLRAPDPVASKRYLRWFLPTTGLVAVGFAFFAFRLGLVDLQTWSVRPWVKPHLADAFDVTLGQHILTESRVFLHYLKLLLLPLPAWMSIDHWVEVSRSFFHHGAGVALLVHAGLLILAWVAVRRGYVLAAFGIFWFYVALIPYIILPQAELFVEYKTYVPSVGLLLVAAEFLRRVRSRRTITTTAACIVLILVMMLLTTRSRNSIFRDRLTLWADAVEKSPEHPRALFHLAGVHLERGRYEKAIDLLEQSIAVEGNAYFRQMIHYRAHHDLAIAYRHLGDREKAYQHFRVSLDLNPKNTKAWLSYGSLQLQSGLVDDATATFEEAVAINLEFAEGHSMLGVAYEALERYDDAIARYERALELDPDFAEAQNNLGSAFAKLGEPEKAEASFRRALSLDPDHIETTFNLGTLLSTQQRYHEAISLFQRAIDTRPDSSTLHLGLARTHRAVGSTERARSHYQQASNMAPTRGDVLTEYGQYLMELKQYAQAVTPLNEVVRLHPDQPRPRLNLGIALAYAGSHDTAAHQFREILRVNPNHVLAQRWLKTLQKMKDSR